MKSRILIIITTIIFLVVSCTPTAPEPTPTPIPTPMPTATPIPEPITGTIFWDANGSGLQDETSFIVPEFNPSDPPYFFELLAANDIGLGNLSPGELATIPEPPIPGIGVCLGNVCTEIDVDGSFTIQPEKAQDTYYLKFTDPHADDPARAFRYINKWNGPVVIESYEMNGVSVPEQYLNDTKSIGITKRISVAQGNSVSIGLMQGFVTYPYETSKYTVGVWFDHNPKQGAYINYQGDTNPKNNPAKVNINGDNHDGIDFDIPIGENALAMAEGWVNYSDMIGNYEGSLHVTLDHQDRDFATGTGHHSELLVVRDQTIYRGQIIALTGKSGTSWPHIHLSFHFYEMGKNPPPTTDPFGVLYETDDSFEKLSWWTVHNIPQFPLMGR